MDAAAAAAKSLQSCPTLCDPIDSSPLGSPVPRILQARTLEWVAIVFSDPSDRAGSNPQSVFLEAGEVSALVVKGELRVQYSFLYSENFPPILPLLLLLLSRFSRVRLCATP